MGGPATWFIKKLMGIINIQHNIHGEFLFLLKCGMFFNSPLQNAGGRFTSSFSQRLSKKYVFLVKLFIGNL